MNTSPAAPEFVPVCEAVRLFGVSKSALYVLFKDGTVKSHVLRRPGNQSGRRLVNTASLRSYIEAQPAYVESHPAK